MESKYHLIICMTFSCNLNSFKHLVKQIWKLMKKTFGPISFAQNQKIKKYKFISCEAHTGRLRT